MLRFGFLLTTTFLIAFPLCGTTVLWDDTDHRLDTPVEDPEARYPKVAATGDRVYVVWEDERNGNEDVYFNRSLDQGITWRPTDTRINTSAAGERRSMGPQVAASGSRVYVVWFEPRTYYPDIFFNYSTNGGTTWQPSDIRLNTDAAGEHYAAWPLIHIDGDMVWVVWKDGRNSDWNTLNSLYMNHSTDGGETWQSSDSRISMETGTEISDFQIENNATNVYVVWQQLRTEGDGVFLNWSTNNGVSFQPADTKVNHNTSDGDVYTPNLSVQGSVLNVVWWYSFNYNSYIMANRSVNGGLDWQATDTELVYPGSAPALASSTSQLALVYPKDDELLFVSSEDQGLTWSDEAKVVRPYSVRDFEDWHIQTHGQHVVVIWQDLANLEGDILCNGSSNSGEVFGTIPSVVNTTHAVYGYLHRPDLAVNEDFSRVYVVWQQDFMTYFRAGTPTLFADGFDLGTTSQWSDVVE